MLDTDPEGIINELRQQVEQSLQGGAENNTSAIEGVYGKEAVDMVRRELTPEAQPVREIRENPKPRATKLESSIEPESVEGRTPVTLSGLTENERLEAVEKRKKETSLNEQGEAANALLGKIKKYNSLKNGRLGKQKSEGLSLLNSIRVDANKLGFSFDEKSGKLLNKNKRAVKETFFDGAVEESGKPLMQRDGKVAEVLQQLLDADQLPVFYDAKGQRMSESRVNAAIEDIQNGIPSIRANRVLDKLEEYIAKDKFEIFDNAFGGFSPSLSELLQTSKEAQTEPLTEEALLEWLEGESKLTPEQEEILIDNIENIIEDYEPGSEKTTSPEVPKTEPAGQAKSSEKSKPAAKAKISSEKPDNEKSDTSAQKLKGKFSDKVRAYAQQVRDGKAAGFGGNMPEGVRKAGFSTKGFNEAAARAIEIFAEAIDRTGDFAEAVNEGFEHLKKYLSENTLKFNEAKWRSGFEAKAKELYDEFVGDGKENIRLAHADTEQIYLEAGLPLRMETPTKHRAQLEQEADEILSKGYDFDKVAEETMNGDRKWEDTDQVLFARKVADLKAKQKNLDINSPEFDAIQKEIEKLSRASDVAGTIGGRFLESRKAYRPVEESISDFIIIEKETLGVDELTPAQKEVLKKEYDDLQKAKAEFDEYVAKKNADLTAKEAEAEFNKLKSSPRKPRKTHDDFVAERKSLREELAAAKKEHDDWLKSQGIQKSGFGSLTAKEAKIIAKIVRSYADEGVATLKDVVEKVLDEVKVVIPNIEESDIRDVIGGAYNDKKPTRNELAAKLKSLKDEQLLLDKLDRLERGEEPPTEKRKIERNQKLKELREKIKGHDLTKLGQAKSKIKSNIDKIEKQIKDGDFDAPEKPKQTTLDEEGHKLRDRYMQLKQQRDARVLLNQRMAETSQQRGMRMFTEILGIPRTLMTIGDFSALLRQNIFFTAGHPIKTARALPGMFKTFTSQKTYDRWFADLKEHPRYQVFKDMKLSIADSLSHDLTEREEAFMSTIAERLPIVGNMKVKGVPVGLNIVKGSERSYTMLLNKMRVDIANDLIDKLEARGLTFENSPKVYKAVGEYINNATGRSDFGKTLNRIAPVLNNTFFSPRLIASRVNMLTYWAQPRFWKTLPREARIDYFRNWISLLGTGMLILAIAKLGGAEVEDDPRSSDFGKIKSGNTRWDIWGGAQPYVRVVAQVWEGERKSTKSGKIYELSGDDIFGETRAGVVSDFFRNKLAPVPGAAVDILSGRTSMGDKIVYQWGGEKNKEISISEYVRQRVLPMTITGTQEALKDQGTKALFTVGIPSSLGVGTQTYDSKATSSRDKQKKPAKPKKPKKPNPS
jgi:hypothetical protein